MINNSHFTGKTRALTSKKKKVKKRIKHIHKDKYSNIKDITILIDD